MVYVSRGEDLLVNFILIFIFPEKGQNNMIKLMRVAVAILYFTFSSILITLSFARKEMSF